jgi:hypothetical protein
MICPRKNPSNVCFSDIISERGGVEGRARGNFETAELCAAVWCLSIIYLVWAGSTSNMIINGCRVLVYD